MQIWVQVVHWTVWKDQPEIWFQSEMQKPLCPEISETVFLVGGLE